VGSITGEIVGDDAHVWSGKEKKINGTKHKETTTTNDDNERGGNLLVANPPMQRKQLTGGNLALSHFLSFFSVSFLLFFFSFVCLEPSCSCFFFALVITNTRFASMFWGFTLDGGFDLGFFLSF
jgi:hypothetical protein